VLINAGGPTQKRAATLRQTAMLLEAERTQGWRWQRGTVRGIKALEQTSDGLEHDHALEGQQALLEKWWRTAGELLQTWGWPWTG
jgi:hypothetical protein